MKKNKDIMPYTGKILNESSYTKGLQNRLEEAIHAYRHMERIGTPSMLYIAAWKKDDPIIWYEYICSTLPRLLGCRPEEAAKQFLDSVEERRIYKYTDLQTNRGISRNIEATEGVENTDPANATVTNKATSQKLQPENKKDNITNELQRQRTIKKELLPQNELKGERDSLRNESISAGATEAVYKLRLNDKTNKSIWVKDIADIEWYPQDNIFLSLGSLTDVTKEMTAEEEREALLLQLQEALEKVKVLSGLLPICANCKQIRDDKGYWKQIETYISAHSDVKFSHGICPDCAQKLYPDLFKDKKPGTRRKKKGKA